MQEKFHKSNLLDKAQLRSLMTRTDNPAISRFVCCFILFLITGGWIVWSWNKGWFWGLFTGQVVGHGLLSTYLVMEHNGLPHEGNILERTRSIRTNKVVNYLLWNMPYHAEHHAYPAVPFHALPLLHEEIKEELVHKEDGLPMLHYEAVRRFGK